MLDTQEKPQTQEDKGERIQLNADPFSLDDLLNESVKQADERKGEKERRQRVALGRGSKEQLAEDVVLLRKWSMEREWKRHGNVLSFSRQKCASCGSFHTTLLGYFELHYSNRLQNTSLMVRVSSFELPSLPKSVHYHDEVVPMCHACADGDDWPLEEG